jgi:RNase adaptor protein for sRNA GlmZ degradation
MLKVRIYSFSYLRSGIPEDNTGNGGGFVFDCRFIDNPGRLPEFIFKTGLDKEVIKFLDSNEEMQRFLNSTYKIIDSVIESYLSMNFTDLMISFGCTGGQHRSVYTSEKMKKHLEQKFNYKIVVDLYHNDIPLY